jgi:hypothetical protein
VKQLAWTLADPADRGVPEVEALAVAAAAAGCEPLGRVVPVPDGVAERWQRHLQKDERREWNALLAAPVQLLLAADHTAVVEVAPFWKVASVRALTPLADGSLVETLFAWSETPPWPGTLRHVHRKARLEREMLRNDTTRGRFVRPVPRGDVPDLLQAHEAHVAEIAALRGTVASPVATLEDAVGVVGRCFAHARMVAGRTASAINLVSLTLLLIALGLTLWADIAWWVPVVALLWWYLVVYVMTPGWWLFFSYTRWIRPAFPPS